MSSRTTSSALGVSVKRCTPCRRSSLGLGFGQAACPFSTTAQMQKTTKLRQDMYQWLDQRKGGEKWRDAPYQPNYLGGSNQPFPLNPLFKSEPVLSIQLRQEVYNRVKRLNQSLKSVSAEFGIDIRRVAAVVRMMEIENRFIAQGKPLAKPYSKAVLKMLPQTPLGDPHTRQDNPHEPINDIHVHKLTMQQLFVPVSESREFTRKDAAKAFHRDMLSTDARSPHPQLIKLQKARLNGQSSREAVEEFHKETKEEEEALLERVARRAQEEEARTTRVDTGRFEYRFKDFNMEVAGKDGRGRRGVGWRYGVPYYDRKKGNVKIPTSVP